MKTKQKTQTKFFPVVYRWVDRGVKREGMTVWDGQSREDAERRFVRLNRHVEVVR